MEYLKEIHSEKVNAKIFHRIEACQKCGSLKRNTELKHLSAGRKLRGICYSYYEKLKRDPLEWRFFTQ